MIKSYKFRIYPNKNQEAALLFTLNTCRHLYNDSLAERIHNAEINKLYDYWQLFPWGKPPWIHKYEQMASLTRNKTDYQRQVYAQVLQNVINRVDKTYINFFNGAGYPRFQGRNRYDSFTYPQNWGYKIIDNKLKLSKIGLIKIIQHRPIEGKIKTCTIKRDVDQWYVTFVCEVDNIPLPPSNQSIGIDVGLNSLITTSTGEQIPPPKFLRKSEHQLKKTQRSLSNKKKGSSNRNKQRIEVARIHRHIRNQRKDFNHKLSHQLIQSYDTIVFEKLQIKNMVKNHCLAKSIQDASWQQLIIFTQYKAEYAGRNVELVNPRNTSKTCSKCGNIQDMPLSQRTYNCPSCGLTLDRDHNAAINILNKHIPRDTGELTPMEIADYGINETGSLIIIR